MKIIGVIAEYNPFHNGHIYHLEKIKELEPDSLLIAVITTTFTQRGIPSYLDKYTKTRLCLEYGIDLVVELPFAFATQGADIFAKGAIQILSSLGVEEIYFGSECNDVALLTKLAKTSFESDYQKRVREYLKNGENYPTALNMAFLNNEVITTPNDLLGLSYIKEIIRQNCNIVPKTVQRTNSFHEQSISSKITSATSIRQAIIEEKEFLGTVPDSIYEYLKEQSGLEEAYFPFFKYKVLSSDDLSIFQTVDEGIENRIKKVIQEATSFEDFIQKIKTKRYTYNRIKRMCCHILCDFTKERAKQFSDIEYLRVLGFSEVGKEYLHAIKKNIDIPIITTLSKGIGDMLEYEKKVLSIYSLVFPIDKQKKLWQIEFQKFPVQEKN